MICEVPGASTARLTTTSWIFQSFKRFYSFSNFIYHFRNRYTSVLSGFLTVLLTSKLPELQLIELLPTSELLESRLILFFLLPSSSKANTKEIKLNNAIG